VGKSSGGTALAEEKKLVGPPGLEPALENNEQHAQRAEVVERKKENAHRRVNRVSRMVPVFTHQIT